MRIAYLGNFVPEHSTENHVRQAWLDEGHEVVRVQEGDPEALATLIKRVGDVEMVLWTRTADLAAKSGDKAAWALLTAAERAGVPTVGFHLDRWWGLNRESTVWTSPFFRCQYVITADGGHPDSFAEIGVNHFWLPPAVSLPETEPGEPQPQYRSPLAFVGSWQGGYHKEWQHRADLVRWLQIKYRNQIKFWPQAGQPSVRGEALRNLYASVDIVIGDSCLAGNATHYWSDRIPETIGRGGFLIHPWVEGLDEHFRTTNHYETPHLFTWNAGDWNGLKAAIEWAKDHPDERRAFAAAGREHVRKHHTYNRRVNQILEIVAK